MITDNDKLPDASWCCYTLGHLKDQLAKLTPAQLEHVLPSLEQEREQAWQAGANRVLGHVVLKYNLPTAEAIDLMSDNPHAKRHLFRNAEVVYCARSLDECWALFEIDVGVSRADEEKSDPFVQVPDEEVLDIASEDSTGEEGEVARPIKPGSTTMWYFVKKPAAQWAKEFGGSGHFSGGDY